MANLGGCFADVDAAWLAFGVGCKIAARDADRPVSNCGVNNSRRGGAARNGRGLANGGQGPSRAVFSGVDVRTASDSINDTWSCAGLISPSGLKETRAHGDTTVAAADWDLRDGAGVEVEDAGSKDFRPASVPVPTSRPPVWDRVSPRRSRRRAKKNAVAVLNAHYRTVEQDSPYHSAQISTSKYVDTPSAGPEYGKARKRAVFNRDTEPARWPKTGENW
ncbi:hypothetical protein DFH09DRAFT_1096284 [Mycena vulgaris]|nr:hypothetical protein DFH09DRAFT_1096284 [Mycena vulgaris]